MGAVMFLREGAILTCGGDGRVAGCGGARLTWLVTRMRLVTALLSTASEKASAANRGDPRMAENTPSDCRTGHVTNSRRAYGAHTSLDTVMTNKARLHSEPTTYRACIRSHVTLASQNRS